MDSSPDDATYSSRTTATEYLESVAMCIRGEKLRELETSPVIAVMGDESTDAIRTVSLLSLLDTDR